MEKVTVPEKVETYPKSQDSGRAGPGIEGLLAVTVRATQRHILLCVTIPFPRDPDCTTETELS